jgi:hypothetical protein
MKYNQTIRKQVDKYTTNHFLASMLVKTKPKGGKKQLAKLWTNSQIVEKWKAKQTKKTNII